LSAKWIFFSPYQSAFQNRRNVGFGEQDPSANPSMLDSILSNDPSERLGANLKHRCRGFCGVNFHAKTAAIR